MRRVWLIRAGEDAETIDAMRDADLIGLSNEVIGDVGRSTPAEIEQLLIDAGHGTRAPGLRSMLVSFANDVRPGDVIVSPNAHRREVWVGVASGEYRYSDDPQVARFGHTRVVDWLGWLDRDAAWMRDQSKSLDRPPVMYELSGREWWFDQIDLRTFATAPRTIFAKQSSSRSSSPRASSATTPRAARAPRARAARAAPTASTRKPPVAMVRCAGTCGFQWAPTSLVDGLCNDCRADL